MAEINTGGGEQKKGKPKKMHLRVDFTPMVDMNMLLITFFMFCTTLSKPQMMDLVMPIKDVEDLTEEEKTKTDEKNTITLLLAEKDVLYYYFGKPNFDDYTSLVETNYSPEGFRAMLVSRNGKIISKMAELRASKQKKEISEDNFAKQSKEIKKTKDALVIIIKPMTGSTYKNLVDVLDEMQICSIGQYAIVDVEAADEFLVKNLLAKGETATQKPK